MPQKPPTSKTKKRQPTPKYKLTPLPVDDPTPPPGPGHLPPIPLETAAEHRGFLFWAMQDPSRRSMRAVSRALDVGDITIRRWRAKRRWDERMKVEASDRLAWAEYLGRYVDAYGIDGMGVIQPLMDVQGPLSPLAIIRARMGPASDAKAYPAESASRRALEAAADMSRQVLGDALHDPDPDKAPDEDEQVQVVDLEEDDDDEIQDEPAPTSKTQGKKVAGGSPNSKTGKGEKGREKASSAPSDDRQDDPDPGLGEEGPSRADPGPKRARVDDYRQIIRGTLGVYARDLMGGKVKVSPRDAVLLIELEQALAEAPKDAQGRGPVESVRVRIAREQGDDLLDALGQDLSEQGVILSALRQKRAQELADLSHQMARAL